MNHNDPESAHTRNDCARLFCGEIRMLFAYASKSMRGGHCLRLVEEYRSKFRTAVPTIVSEEDVLIRASAVLAKYIDPIRGYDDKFFSSMNIVELFETSSQDIPISDSDRDEFYSSTTPLMRTNVMDSLNILLVLCAKYDSMREQQ